MYESLLVYSQQEDIHLNTCVPKTIIYFLITLLFFELSVLNFVAETYHKSLTIVIKFVVFS